MVPASPAEVYDALTKAKTFCAFTGGAPAEIDARAGGAISLFGGRVTGLNVELEPNVRVVQAWRAGNWGPGEHSLVRFELKPEGAGTLIMFDQSGHPPSAADHLASGWEQMYWAPMRAHFG